MVFPLLLLLLYTTAVIQGAVVSNDDHFERISLRMPKAKPKYPENYLCTPMKLNKDRTYYITGYEPKADMATAHHMLLYGCKSPGAEAPIFNCGSMSSRTEEYPTRLSPCGAGNQIVYAWALNAPDLKLPHDVAFRVGKDTDVEWLVLQVHYASVDFIPEEGDESGLIIRYTDVERPKAAGVYYLTTNGRIAPHSKTNMEAACTMKEDKMLHPFAFRVHTHSLGKVVSGWKVENGNRWTLVGKEDPQKPQMFYDVKSPSPIHRGDTIAMRCTMDNDRSSAVWVGATRNDEMCNFYMMYWVDGHDILRTNHCSSVGPPIYKWNRWWPIGSGLQNVPEEEASTL